MQKRCSINRTLFLRLARLFCHGAKTMKNSRKQKIKLALRIKLNYCTFADLIVVITEGFKTLLIN